MNRIIKLLVFAFVLYLIDSPSANGQEASSFQGYFNAELSVGQIGDAKNFEYKSIGLATGYGKMINNSSYFGLGVKPNYISSDGDFEGFFMPIYGEYKYQPIIEAKIRGFGGIRVGYSPFSKKGAYARIGGYYPQPKMGIQFGH